jgi:ankyrin repeat protein
VLSTSLWAGEIHDAAASGDLVRVRALLEADSTLLESRDQDGRTPLNKACRGADPDRNLITRVEVANYLLDKGADVNTRDNYGLTPLMQVNVSSPDQKCYDLMQRLISMGADVNASMTGRNWTKIRDAVFYLNLKVARLLIDNGADINLRDIEGTTLQKSIHNNNYSVDIKRKEEMSVLLVENGAKLQEFSFGNTELHLAAIRGFADLATVLVKHGADVNAMNEYGHTPLYYAARHGHLKTAEALIAAGADKNAIVETNYDKAPQLTEKLKAGEAYIWYLASSVSPHLGYAVKTRNHMLIFDPYGINKSPEAGLANGNLNPNELASQKITVFNSCQIYLPDISNMAQAIPDINFVLSVKPTVGDTGNSIMPPYHVAAANESFSVEGIQVHTIPTANRLFGKEGLGYLVEVDSLKVFHAGLHFSGYESSNVAEFCKEIDFLKPFGPVDIAILPVSGRHITVNYEPYLYLIDQLRPKAIYLIGEDLVTEEHLKCIEVLKSRNVPVFYPEGGIAVGQRFHYLHDSK